MDLPVTVGKKPRPAESRPEVSAFSFSGRRLKNRNQQSRRRVCVAEEQRARDAGCQKSSQKNLSNM